MLLKKSTNIADPWTVVAIEKFTGQVEGSINECDRPYCILSEDTWIGKKSHIL